MNRIAKGKHMVIAVLVMFTLVLGYISIAKASIAIETDKKTSLTITTQGENYGSELKTLSMKVKLYQVADVNAGQKYTEKEGFTSLEIGKLTDKGGEVTAQAWEEVTKKAKDLVEQKQIQADVEGTIENGTLTMGKLSTGMYLVDVEAVNSSEYTYSFAPHLVALPAYVKASDSWNYDVEIALKASREPRYGDLEIVKHLDGFNTLLGKTTFVFQVEGEKDGEKYSNVVSLDFTQAGEQKTLLEHLPAGMEVTVTEIYTGSSYQLTSPAEQKETIVAEDVVSTQFRNDYKGNGITGYGVENQFSYDDEEGWIWETKPGSFPEQE